VGKVSVKSNANEALNDDVVFKTINADEGLSNGVKK
jgi:hypothetical protein